MSAERTQQEEGSGRRTKGAFVPTVGARTPSATPPLAQRVRSSSQKVRGERPPSFILAGREGRWGARARDQECDISGPIESVSESALADPFGYLRFERRPLLFSVHWFLDSGFWI